MSTKARATNSTLETILTVNIMLKLFGLIAWSWWAVLWPAWFVVAVCALAAGVDAYLKASSKNENRE